MSDLFSERVESSLSIEALVLVLCLKELLGEPLGDVVGDTFGDDFGEAFGETQLNQEPLKELLGECSWFPLKLSEDTDHLEELIDKEFNMERKKPFELEHEGPAGSAPVSSSLDGEKQSNVLLECTEASLSMLIGEEENGEGKEKSTDCFVSSFFDEAPKSCNFLQLRGSLCRFLSLIFFARKVSSSGGKFDHVLNALQVPGR